MNENEDVKLFGYARTSTKDQKLDLQIDALKKYGVPESNLFFEQMTGTRKDRPQLQEMFKYLRAGDTVVVWKMDRIGRSTQHLVEIMNEFKEKGINFVSMNESIDTSTPTGKLVFTIFAALAEFERDITVERVTAGLEAARARGREGGRPKKKKDVVDRAFKMYDSKMFSVEDILESTGMARSTFYKYLNEREVEREKEALK